MYAIPLQDEFMTDMEAGIRRSRGSEENFIKREQYVERGNDRNDGERLIGVDMDRETRLVKRDGGADGVVLSLTSKGDGFYDVFYTLDVDVGTPPTVFPLLLDTGSSDLWVASSECNCASLSYSPSTSSTSTALPQSLNTTYLLGSFSGPLYTDTLSIGPYTLAHQALCGATIVQNENMGLGFSGIIGLGLAGLSTIQDALSTGQGGSGNADAGGQPVLMNLFNASVIVGGTASVPTQRWFSLVLDRPGFDQDDIDSNSTSSNSTTTNSTSTSTAWNHIWPARLGIGSHVEEITHAFSQALPNTSGTNANANASTTAALESALQPLPLVPSLNGGGYTHWKTRLSGITVYQGGGGGVDGNGETIQGTPVDIRLSRGVDGGAFPVAVLDSGGANVLASRAVADAVYGAWGIGMGSDGIYYVPCTQVMNITITLATSSPIPIHPLDMSTYLHNDPSTNTCLGTIQFSSQLGIPGSPADVALGISFLRNVYTVHQLDTPSSGTGTYTSDSTTPTPRLAIAPLTNPTLALTEFNNVRVLGLTPSGEGRATPPMTGSPSESLGTLSKVGLGVGLFLSAVVLIFATRWFVLRRRFEARRRAGLGSHPVSEMGHGAGAGGVAGGGGGGGGGGKWSYEGVVEGVAEFAEVMRRKTTMRTRKRRKKKEGFGAWRAVSDDGHEEVDGLAGHVATRSAAGHGSIRRKDEEPGDDDAFDQVMMAGGVPMGGRGRGVMSDRRSAAAERQGSGPFAGFSLWTFVGARRLFGPRHGAGGGLYELTVNPAVQVRIDVDVDDGEGQLMPGHGHARRGNESSVWSEATWVDRGDGTLVPTGTGAAKSGTLQYNEFGERKTYGYAGTPNETVVGGSSTTHLVGGLKNEYGFTKDTASDDGSDRGSTIHASPEFGKGGRAGIGSHSRSSSASNIPLMALPMASTSSLAATATGNPGQISRPPSGGQGMGHGTHRSVPSLELNLPTRLDSSGIIAASPDPLTGTPGEGRTPFGPFGTPPRMISGTPPSGTPPRLSATPPGIASIPPRLPSIPTNSDTFNPFDIPTTVHPPPPTLVHPPKARTVVAVEPSLSPLTEVNSSEFPPSSSNRMSIMSALTAAAVAQNTAGLGPDRESLERQDSIGAMSMESDVLVPLPIEGMKLPSRWRNSPPPMDVVPTPTPTPAERRWGDPLPAAPQRVLEVRPPPVSVPPPPPPPPPVQKKDASRSLPVQKSAPAVHPVPTSFTLPSQSSSNPFYPPIIPAAAPPQARQPSSTPPAPRPNNPYDMLALNDFSLGSMSKDSRFPARDTLTLGVKDSRFPVITPTSFSNVPTRPIINTRSSSVDRALPVIAARPDDTAHPPLRTRASEMELPRPQSAATKFGAEKSGGALAENGGVGVNVSERPWMKPRSQSGGAASLPSTSRPAGPSLPTQSTAIPAAHPAMLDFAPPHNYRPGRPEQHSLPTMGSAREEPRPVPPSRVSDPATSSMGTRSRGPRPMVTGPRSPKSTGSSSSNPGSTHSAPNSPPSAGNQSSGFQSRHGTNSDSPLPSISPSTPSTAPLTPGSSLPPGARAPTDPRLHSHHRLPTIPRNVSSPSISVPTAPAPNPVTPPALISPPAHPRSTPIPIPPTRPGIGQYPATITREASAGTTEEAPDSIYGGMAGDEVAPTGWREVAAQTAGVAGVGARSRFTGPTNPYPSPFDDRP